MVFKISDLPKPAFMDKTPKELGIGSWENILTIDKSTPLIEAMKTFLSKRVSALPLIDSDGKVFFNFSVTLKLSLILGG